MGTGESDSYLVGAVVCVLGGVQYVGALRDVGHDAISGRRRFGRSADGHSGVYGRIPYDRASIGVFDIRRDVLADRHHLPALVCVVPAADDVRGGFRVAGVGSVESLHCG